jgi:L-ascorbate metabolism protein UlaG (beta-lactamase superfamily)
LKVMKPWKWVLAVMIALLVITLPALTVFSKDATQTTGKTQLLWYGQSAFKLTTPAGKVLLIDPFITNPANPNGKEDVAKLDKVDLILISHGHFDHTGNAVEIAQKTKAKLVSTADLGQALVQYSGYPKDLVTFETQGNFGGELNLLNNEVKIAFIPAIHSSAIASDGSPANYAGNPGGFLISIKNGPVIYHTGDTDLFADMALIPHFRPVTLMLTCIGDQFTMGPERAAEAVKLVNPKMVVPMHFGIFGLPGTPEAFTQALQQQGVRSQVKRMQVGETLSL